MEKPDRRPAALAGLGLISAGAVLGLALTTPAAAAPTDTPKPKSTPAGERDNRS
jgi:hypothetical protein